MYSRTDRTILAAIGEERAAKLNYELTRHHIRQQEAINMDEMLNSNNPERLNSDHIDVVGVEVIGSEIAAIDNLNND